jgi:hypothetical protein
MNKLIILTLLQVFSISVFGQLTQPQLDSLVNRYVQNLHKKGVDTICIYNEYCIGCLFHPATGSNLCAEKFSSLPTYIFWKDKGKTFVTRKDICFEYSTQLIKTDAFWNYYFSNKDKIKKEKLKIPQYVDIVNGKKEIKSINIDQTIYFRITFDIANDPVIKDINSFYFTRELGPEEELNINYDFNIQTSLSIFHTMIQTIIKGESFMGKFERTLR